VQRQNHSQGTGWSDRCPDDSHWSKASQSECQFTVQQLEPAPWEGLPCLCSTLSSHYPFYLCSAGSDLWVPLHSLSIIHSVFVHLHSLPTIQSVFVPSVLLSSLPHHQVSLLQQSSSAVILSSHPQHVRLSFGIRLGL